MIRPLFSIAVALVVTAAAGVACDTARPTLLPPLTIPAPLVGLEDGTVAVAGFASRDGDAGVGEAPDPAQLSPDAGPGSRAAIGVATRPKVARRARQPARRGARPPERPSPERPAGGENAAPEPPSAEQIDGVTVSIDDDDDNEPPPAPARSRPSRLGQTPIAEGFD